jgi:hypothetical protein
MKNHLMKTTIGIATCVAAAGLAYAAVNVEADGTGFIGKGDVQDAFGWNNAQLQSNASGVTFAVESTVVTEVSWVCTNSNNDTTQERARTTTTTVSGLLDSEERDKKNQVTGFNLFGYDGSAVTETATEGNPLNSCPGGPWSLTTPAGDPEVVFSESSVTATFGGVTKSL